MYIFTSGIMKLWQGQQDGKLYYIKNFQKKLMQLIDTLKWLKRLNHLKH